LLNYLLIIITFSLILIWPNMLKKAKATRAEYFYWDFLIAVFILSIAFAITIGLSPYYNLPSVEKDLIEMFRFALRAMLAGMIVNIAYFLTILSSFLVGITYGMNVPFSIAMATEGIIVVLLQPHAFAGTILAAVVFFILSTVFFNIACRRNTEKTYRSKKAITFAVLAGMIFGFFFPLLGKSFNLEDSGKLAPHIAFLFFSSGFVIGNIFLSFLFRNKPLISPAFSFKGYLNISFKNHLYGFIAGTVWALAAICRFFTNIDPIYGFAFVISHTYTLLMGLFGIFLWKEYKNNGTYKYLFFAYASFIIAVIFLSFERWTIP